MCIVNTLLFKFSYFSSMSMLTTLEDTQMYLEQLIPKIRRGLEDYEKKVIFVLIDVGRVQLKKWHLRRRSGVK